MKKAILKKVLFVSLLLMTNLYAVGREKIDDDSIAFINRKEISKVDLPKIIEGQSLTDPTGRIVTSHKFENGYKILIPESPKITITLSRLKNKKNKLDLSFKYQQEKEPSDYEIKVNENSKLYIGDLIDLILKNPDKSKNNIYSNYEALEIAPTEQKPSEYPLYHSKGGITIYGARGTFNNALFKTAVGIYIREKRERARCSAASGPIMIDKLKMKEIIVRPKELYKVEKKYDAKQREIGMDVFEISGILINGSYDFERSSFDLQIKGASVQIYLGSSQNNQSAPDSARLMPLGKGNNSAHSMSMAMPMGNMGNSGATRMSFDNTGMHLMSTGNIGNSGATRMSFDNTGITGMQHLMPMGNMGNMSNPGATRMSMDNGTPLMSVGNPSSSGTSTDNLVKRAKRKS